MPEQTNEQIRENARKALEKADGFLLITYEGDKVVIAHIGRNNLVAAVTAAIRCVKNVRRIILNAFIVEAEAPA